VRPTFNVTEFQEVVNVQMNDSMRELLASFIDDVDCDDGLEIEIKAFRNALLHPQGSNRRTSGRGHQNRNRVAQDRDPRSRIPNHNSQSKRYEKDHDYTPPADYQGINGAGHE